MLRNILLYMTMAVLALTQQGCSSDDDTFSARQGEHTILIYMAAENNLTADVMRNLQELKEGTRQLSDNNNVVIYVDRSSSKELPWMARVSRGQITDSVSLKDMGISDKDELTSDPHVFEDVIRYAFQRYPATKDYGLLLWGHSTGWILEDDIPYTRGFGVDNGRNDVNSAQGKWLNVTTMARVLKKLPHLKFIFADCCNFMCLESIYELRQVADYIIGSPAEIPEIGAPYNTVVPALLSSSDNFAVQSADMCFERKVKGLELPLAVAKTSEMEQLAQATRVALKAVNNELSGGFPDMTGIMYYYYRNPKFFYHPEYNVFYDAGDFFRTHLTEADYQSWKQALDKVVVYKKYSTKWNTDKMWDTFYGSNFIISPEKEHGVSMFVPQSPLSGDYAKYNLDIQQYEWYKAAGYKEVGW